MFEEKTLEEERKNKILLLLDCVMLWILNNECDIQSVEKDPRIIDITLPKFDIFLVGDYEKLEGKFFKFLYDLKIFPPINDLKEEILSRIENARKSSRKVNSNLNYERKDFDLKNIFDEYIALFKQKINEENSNVLLWGKSYPIRKK